MCLCWNNDGTMCGPEELKRRMWLYSQGLYKPELKAFREKMDRERAEKRAEKLPAIMEKYKDYDWSKHWKHS